MRVCVRVCVFFVCVRVCVCTGYFVEDDAVIVSAQADRYGRPQGGAR
jgi:hypothetical protein